MYKTDRAKYEVTARSWTQKYAMGTVHVRDTPTEANVEASERAGGSNVDVGQGSIPATGEPGGSGPQSMFRAQLIKLVEDVFDKKLAEFGNTLWTRIGRLESEVEELRKSRNTLAAHVTSTSQTSSSGSPRQAPALAPVPPPPVHPLSMAMTPMQLQSPQVPPHLRSSPASTSKRGRRS